MKYFLFFLRKPSIIAALTRLTETNTTLLEGRLGLTKMKRNYPPTGTLRFLGSVLV